MFAGCVVEWQGEARLINKQVGCQAGAQSEEGASAAPLAGWRATGERQRGVKDLWPGRRGGDERGLRAQAACSLVA
jgi:hypothetical protein